MFWTLDNIRQVTAGRFLKRPTAEADLQGVSTDSRAIARGQVFVALPGENFDGHDYLEQAAGAGATLLIVSDEARGGAAKTDAAVLLVDNTINALARLARAYRQTLSAEVIAITGSVGKSTTKQIIHDVLSPFMAGSAARASFNNEIGVPLTLLAAKPNDKFIVVEVGTNAPGEINALARIVEPDVAIITAVGRAHLEKLGTVEAVAAEKAALLRHLRDDGVAIVNGDVESLAPYLKPVPRVIRYGRGSDCDLRLTDCSPNDRNDGLRFTVNDRATFDLPLPGEHNALNATAAVAVARHLSLTDEQIAEGLAGADTMPMRLNIARYGKDDAAVTVINDAYNANPESVAAAIDVLAATPTTGRRIAVLGDMLELGGAAPQLHREVGQRLAALSVEIDGVIVVGSLAVFIAEELERTTSNRVLGAFTVWQDSTADDIAAAIQPGDVVLLKASRRMGLERCAVAIERCFNATGADQNDSSP